jgi:hypothetical protein
MKSNLMYEIDVTPVTSSDVVCLSGLVGRDSPAAYPGRGGPFGGARG